MRTIGIAIVALALLIGGVFLFASRPAATTSSSGQTFSSVQGDVANGAVLLDVRTAEEFTISHFVGAENHSLQLMQAGTLPDIDTNTTVYVYCQSGNRSAQAASILQDAGYAVVDLGGLRDVKAIGGTLQEG